MQTFLGRDEIAFEVALEGGYVIKRSGVTAKNLSEGEKTAIYKFTNDQSHITGDGFDPSLVPEAQKSVKYLLEMMKAVFPEHYQILEEQFSEQSSFARA